MNLTVRHLLRRHMLLATLTVLGCSPLYAQVAAPAEPAPANSISVLERTPKSLDELKVLQDHFRKMADQLMPSTVGIRVGPAQGSGVIINKEGYVLTAGHVAGAPDRRAEVILWDGRRVSAITLGVNEERDSGMLKITTPGDWSVAALGDSSEIDSGDWVLALGHPGGFQTGRKPVLRLGRVLDKDDELITTDCTLVGGDSGGPLFDVYGRVIGIHSRIGASIKANMHVPANEYRETWDRLVAGEAWGFKSYIGVMGDPDADEAVIADVHPGTPADRAGVKRGDVIVRFDGKEVKNFADLREYVQATRPGKRVVLAVRRKVEDKDSVLELPMRVGRRN